MLAHTKAHHTDLLKISIEMPNLKREVSYISTKYRRELETFLKEHAIEEDIPVEWKILAKERIEKHKKAGLVLRGIRYREGISQKELAKLSKVSQTEISKIENGKRVVGKKVAKKLADALKIDYRLLTEA